MDFRHSFWIDPALIDSHSDEPRFNTETCFQMETPSCSQVALNADEHSEYRWCSPSEALELMKWESSKAALDKLMRSIAE
jgi:hypothetical protein